MRNKVRFKEKLFLGTTLSFEFYGSTIGKEATPNQWVHGKCSIENAFVSLKVNGEFLRVREVDQWIEDLRKLKENDEIFEFKILETPGHSSGDICYYDEECGILFSGDTMFKGTYGRVDLPTSNSADMWKSLQKLISLPNMTMVYPGHGDVTTIGIERNLYSY